MSRDEGAVGERVRVVRGVQAGLEALFGRRGRSPWGSPSGGGWRARAIGGSPEDGLDGKIGASRRGRLGVLRLGRR